MVKNFEISYDHENKWVLKKTLLIDGKIYYDIKNHNRIQRLIEKIYLNFCWCSYFPSKDWLQAKLMDVSKEVCEDLISDDLQYRVTFSTVYQHIDWEDTPTYSLGALKYILFAYYENKNKMVTNIIIKPRIKWWQRLFCNKKF